MNLAVVVQRYGASIVGGAEALARTVATLLAAAHRVTVVTTTATDYGTWRNALPAGEERDGAVGVLRFPVERERPSSWAELNGLLYGGLAQTFPTLGRLQKRALERRLAAWPVALQEEYLRLQGPYSPALLAWLDEHEAGYDRFLFFTYLYATTYFGMHCVRGDKVDFYPTLHDEPPAYLPVFGRLFRRASRLLFSTTGELRVAQRLHPFEPARAIVVGYGAREPAPPSVLPLETPYLLYAGRIDPAKGVALLLEQFIRWRREQPQPRVRLVLIGERLMDLPDHPDVEYLGFRSEGEKAALMRQALALVHPSPFESLGLVLIEAFLCGTPGLVFGRNEILVDHCRAANGGLWYDDYAELAAALSWLVSHPEDAKVLGAQGYAYARRHYAFAGYRRRLAALYPGDGSGTGAPR